MTIYTVILTKFNPENHKFTTLASVSFDNEVDANKYRDQTKNWCDTVYLGTEDQFCWAEAITGQVIELHIVKNEV